jgi:hypothetical protein
LIVATRAILRHVLPRLALHVAHHLGTQDRFPAPAIGPGTGRHVGGLLIGKPRLAVPFGLNLSDDLLLVGVVVLVDAPHPLLVLGLAKRLLAIGFDIPARPRIDR